MAHVGCSVQAGHAIVGSKVDVGSALVEQVLCDMQVTPLAGQVEGCGTNGHLVVHTPVHRNQEADTSAGITHTGTF